MNTRPSTHRTCPHCGKEWPRAIQKPRDLGLLLWRLRKLPAITEEAIEAERQHAKMTPERLATLRAEPFTRYWQRLQERAIETGTSWRVETDDEQLRRFAMACGMSIDHGP